MAATGAATTFRYVPIGRRLVLFGAGLVLAGLMFWVLGISDAVDPLAFVLTAGLGLGLLLSGVAMGCCVRLQIDESSRSIVCRGPASWEQGDWRDWFRPRVMPLDEVREVQSLECSPGGLRTSPECVERYLLIWTRASAPWVVAEGLSPEANREIGSKVAQLSGVRYVERIQLGE